MGQTCGRHSQTSLRPDLYIARLPAYWQKILAVDSDCFENFVKFAVHTYFSNKEKNVQGIFLLSYIIMIDL